MFQSSENAALPDANGSTKFTQIRFAKRKCFYLTTIIGSHTTRSPFYSRSNIILYPHILFKNIVTNRLF